MSQFYICKLLDEGGVYFPTTYILGNVEFRSANSSIADEENAIEKSLNKAKLKINKDFVCRMGTIVVANNLESALTMADQKFVETLDLLSTEFPCSRLSFSDCGYFKNLDTGDIDPIESPKLVPSTSYLINRNLHQEIDFKQWLATQNSDLATRFKKSLYWARKARWEKNLQISILFYWFSIEALFKESESDNVAPFIRWFLGFPNGPEAKNIAPLLIKELKSNPHYQTWANRLTIILEEVRTFRNESAHNGFRITDISLLKLKQYAQIMTLSCSRAQNGVRRGLSLGIRNLSDLKSRISQVFESNEQLVNDVHNNIVFSLQHGSSYNYLGAGYE